MVKVTANAAVKDLLGPLEESAEIRDDRGELVGYFTPAKTEVERLRAYAFASYDPEEMARRKASNEPCHTTAEVLERLRSMGRP